MDDAGDFDTIFNGGASSMAPSMSDDNISTGGMDATQVSENDTGQSASPTIPEQGYDPALMNQEIKDANTLDQKTTADNEKKSEERGNIFSNAASGFTKSLAEFKKNEPKLIESPGVIQAPNLMKAPQISIFNSIFGNK